MTHGLISLNETVKWRGRHFGVRLTHESIISAYDKPRHFRDEMVTGMFRSFVHDHFFEATTDGTTLMRDELRFVAPLGRLGLIAERVVLRSYFKRFLKERNDVIKRIAESSDLWQRYLKESRESIRSTIGDQ